MDEEIEMKEVSFFCWQQLIFDNRRSFFREVFDVEFTSKSSFGWHGDGNKWNDTEISGKWEGNTFEWVLEEETEQHTIVIVLCTIDKALTNVMVLTVKYITT